jgi:Bacterial membrane protein YfhO
VKRDRILLLLLAALPVLAHAPAWREERLLGGGDGTALHFPMRAEVFRAYARGDLPSWNPGIFSGTPLLAAYRPGAFHPLMPLLAPFDPFPAFQALVLVSLAATAALSFLFLRRLGAERVGAYVGALSFALGPYLVGHVGDTATLVAAPCLPLVLLAAEVHLLRGTGRTVVALAAAMALLFLAGSPEAVGAGLVLLLLRLAAGHWRRAAARPLASVLALVAGGLVAAPQLFPAAIALSEAGAADRVLTSAPGALPGVTGLVLRYASHTPAMALAFAAIPLLFTHPAVRSAALALLLSFLVAARGRLADPGAPTLALDFSLAVLAGLSLSAQWRARAERSGRRLRAWFLLASLFSAAALAGAAALLGALPQSLAGAVGLLAVALILHFTLAEARNPVAAHVWLLPLTASFVFQPYAREAWRGAPTREELLRGTPTRRALDRVLRARPEDRVRSLVTELPNREGALDLAYGGLGAFVDRRDADGYDPMIARARREAWDGMGVDGALPAAFFRTDPGRLELLGVRFVQVPTPSLLTAPDSLGLGDELDLVLEPVRPRFFALPIMRATEVRLLSRLADAVEVEQGTPVAWLVVRLVSRREVALPVRAGIETAEWAYDRADVVDRVRHDRATVARSAPADGFLGHRYLGVLKLPVRWTIDGLRLEAVDGRFRLSLYGLGVVDATTGRGAGLALPSAYLSDTVRLREEAATPRVRLFGVNRGLGRAWVVDSLRRLGDEATLLRYLREPTRRGVDTRREALVLSREAKGVELPTGSQSSRAEVARESAGRIDLRAEGPGFLVVTEGWDPGWRATVDDVPVPLLRANAVHMGVVLEAGTHRVQLTHFTRGLTPGLVLAGVGVLVLALAWAGRSPRSLPSRLTLFRGAC